ncbi:MAG: DNA/RNA non-specific endonuclease [Saprospiraceae bacterium]
MLVFRNIQFRDSRDSSNKKSISLPILGQKHKNDLVSFGEKNETILNYINYSLQISASRKFPFYTATNIDGSLFKRVGRASSWKKDNRVNQYQFGAELYTAENSEFDKGHMTKRENVQWGESIEDAKKASDSTFYYTNAVPQHKDLNRRIWKRLENYILHKETRNSELKITVFTGPVLSQNDPYFVTEVRNESIQIPILFWKVIIFSKENGELHRVGFMMSQRKLLVDNGIVEELESFSDDELFMQFDGAPTYQVNISFVEELSGLTFPLAIDSYTDTRNLEVILEEIDIELESYSTEHSFPYDLNIIL